MTIENMIYQLKKNKIISYNNQRLALNTQNKTYKKFLSILTKIIDKNC